VRKQCLKYGSAQSAAGLSRVEKRSSSSKIPLPISRPFSFTIAADEVVIGSTFATKFSKFRATAGSTFKSPLDIEIKNSGPASSSRGRKAPNKQACPARALWVASCCFSSCWILVCSSAILVPFDDKSLTNGLYSPAAVERLTCDSRS